MAASDVMPISEKQRARILEIAEAYGATNVRVFGAGAEGDDDLDLLVDMDPARSLFDLVDLGRELGELLGRRVEVIAAASLSPRLQASVFAEARPL
jgi:predicted nucleotidyltransferase